MVIQARQVKELRDATGAGMMDAKQALVATDGDMSAAADWLRKKGIAKAAKKVDREAAEGLVAVVINDEKGVAVELNSETDFVSRNEEFQRLLRDVAQAAINASDIESLLSAEIDGQTIQDKITEKIATTGENLSIRRMATLSGNNIACYVHNAVAAGIGKIGVILAYDGNQTTLGKEIAMHIAATRPLAIDPDNIDINVLDRERQIQADIVRESDTPEEFQLRAVESRMKKFVKESVLISQKFALNPEITVQQAAEAEKITVTSFIRFEVGEGL
ncbi:MAG: translation elongation factor Ts [Aestuariivita sp.]|nr:translation elongation factor Ts [Aestuariivita sp.]MCY4201625.1 translation elongation factor Ts [Aestuariivita sp.]MCY4289039.1 translation elongation factor Ts [Aestuariivita sp.]MCY4347224.1 translation elongation factor Ts [Aestuariivita sp.]